MRGLLRQTEDGFLCASKMCWATMFALLVLLSPLSYGVKAQTAQVPAFDIKSVEASWQEGVYHLNAVVNYELTPQVLEALENGVTLGFGVDIIIDYEREYWFNRNIASLKQKYLLRYHALSDQYILTNLNSGAINNFPTLHGALSDMGNVVNLPVIDDKLLDASLTYTVRMRARLEQDELPTPLRLLSYVKPEWRLASEWYAWNLSLGDD